VRAAVEALSDLTQMWKENARLERAHEMRFQIAAVFAFVSVITKQRDPAAHEALLKSVKEQMRFDSVKDLAN
jgi:hypothetical protein